jgi:hypothetical protein
MDYNSGDVVYVEAIKVRNNTEAGKLYVKIVKKKDGLYFRPFLLKNVTPIPISVIDYYNPVWLMGSKNKSHLAIGRRIAERGLEYYEVMWAIISNAWNETKASVKTVNGC